jgi:hypothetical protein
MKGSIAAGCVAVLALGLIAAPLGAQTTVQGAVIIQSSQRDGRVVRRTTDIGTQRHVVVVSRVAPRRAGWWKRHNYRAVTAYYDGYRYYLRRLARPHLRPVIVYERGGRYYVDESHWNRNHHHHDRHNSR